MDYKILFLFLVLFINYVNADNKYMVFKFRTNINLKEVNDENYMLKKVDQKIYIDLDIGEPSQKIPMVLKTYQYPTYVVSKDSASADKVQVKYDSKISKNYYYDPQLITNLLLYDFKQGYFSNDSLNINPKINNFSFFLATDFSFPTQNISGEIGLSKENPDVTVFKGYASKTQFIQQLLNNQLINKKIFGILYDTEYEGRLIFGDYLFNVEKNYKEKDMNEFTLEDDVPDKNNKMWLLKFDLNCVGGEDNAIIYQEKNAYGFFQIEYGLMIGSTTFLNGFIKDYFMNKNCKNETISASASFVEYYCTDKSQFQDFPDISFKSSGKYNFTFTKDELFIKKGNKYIFQIIFNLFVEDIGIQYWKIGQSFFKKYAIFLKEEEKSAKLSYYLNQKFDNKEDKGGISTQVVVIIVLSVVLAVLIAGIIVYLVYFFPKRRKKRVQELNDDDYVYTPQKEPKDQLLGEDIN